MLKVLIACVTLCFPTARNAMSEAAANCWRTPSLDITISLTEGNSEDQIRNLVAKVKPKWKKELVKMKKLTGGIVNAMYCCWDESIDDSEDRIVVRVHQRPEEFADKPAMDPKKEIGILEKVSQSGLGPELIVLFNNGLCYKFIPGETLNVRTVRSEKFIPHVAELIARLHALPLSGQNLTWGTKEILDWVQEYPPKFKDPTKLKRILEVLPDRETFVREINYLLDVLPTLGSPKVFCHNDTKGENFIWNEKEGKLTFIDFENASDNNQAFEIGHHFASYNDVKGCTPDTYPDRDFQLRWIRLYLEHWFRLTGKKSTDVTDQDVERLYVQANKYAQLSRIAVGVALLSESEGSFQCFDFCLNYLKDYFKYRDEVNALVLPES